MSPALGGILAAIPTPFESDESLRLEALVSNLKRWNETPLDGVTVLGTTGEFVSLSTDEKKLVLAKAREVVPGDKVFVAGTGAESTRETIALSRWAAGIGADYAIVVTPHYLRGSISKNALVDHYRLVADECPIPIVVYHIPQCTGVELLPETVARIAEHENVAGIKDSSGHLESLQEMIRLSRPGFAVLTGSAPMLLAAFLAGADGAILADACVAWAPCCDIQAAFRGGDVSRARKIQAHLAPFSRVLIGRYGIPGVKALLDRMGFYGGPPRRPLLPAPAASGDELLRELPS
jgi:4-hydroxy-2-oxoglutarate aldolase